MAKPVHLAVSLSILLVPLIAEAERERGGSGGGDGGGRLGQVSAGLGRATAGGGGSNGGGGGNGGGWNPATERPSGCNHNCKCERLDPVIVGVGASMTAAGLEEEAQLHAQGQPPAPSPRIDFYVGAQKVHESDGSLSLELAFNEGRFRLGGSLTKYYERQEGAEALTMTLPALYLGVRVTGGGPTRAYLELGGAGLETAQDPVMDSSVAGIVGGVRVEHKTSRRTAVVWDAQVMVFEEGVRAAAGRAGFRVGPLQASLRYLDLNVGPALFGPEVGLRF